jgi:nitrite reductase (NADH) small subunit
MAEYVKVAQASELEPNHGKLVEVQGKKIALFNVDGKFHAIDNTCTHRGGPLSEGELEGDEVTCPWHGAKFKVSTGEVLSPVPRQNSATVKCPPCNMLHALSVCYSFQMRS